MMKRCVCLFLVCILLSSPLTPAFADDGIRYCRMCGLQIPVDSKFCCYCGVSVVRAGENESADSAAAAPKRNAQSRATTSGAGLDCAEAAGEVRITKNPTSASVPCGGSCTFLSQAVNADSVTWTITSEDGSVTVTALEAPTVSPASMSPAAIPTR